MKTYPGKAKAMEALSVYSKVQMSLSYQDWVGIPNEWLSQALWKLLKQEAVNVDSTPEVFIPQSSTTQPFTPRYSDKIINLENEASQSPVEQQYRSVAVKTEPLAESSSSRSTSEEVEGAMVALKPLVGKINSPQQIRRASTYLDGLGNDEQNEIKAEAWRVYTHSKEIDHEDYGGTSTSIA
jgi:hypothetical protein